MDGMNHVIDPREEVKKLQNLVRQLELQNAQLRSRNKRESPPRSSAIAARRRNSLVDKNDNVSSHSLDDVDIIDVDGLDLSDEDSWLFASPKQLTEEQQSISPYKWMRRDVEDPQNKELQTVKRALVNKLDEIARARFTGFSQVHSPPPWSPPESEAPMPHLKPSFDCGKLIDTRTFTRSKKKTKEDADCRLLARHMAGVHGDAQAIARTTLDVETPEEDAASTASAESFTTSTQHRLADVVDVQTLARLQEESLRESSTPSSPRRSSASSSQPSVTSPVTGVETLVANNIAHVSSDPGKALFCLSNPESLDESLHSSPSESPYSSQCLVVEQTKPGSFHHSLPNLNKPQNGTHQVRKLHGSSSPLRQHLSESKLQRPQFGRSGSSQTNTDTDSDKDSRESTPSRELRTLASQSNATLQHRRESGPACTSTPIVRSGSPGPRSGIPQLRRSGSPLDGSPRSNLPKPVSRIPAPRPRMSLPTTSRGYNNSNSYVSDDSWKDGCF